MSARKVAPTSAPATTQRVLVQKMRLERRAAAARGLISEEAVKNATPISDRPDLAKHPATRMPLTFTYANPIGSGGWLGGIEPEDDKWIAFVALDGKTLLWERREKNGGVVGTPVMFIRSDLVPRKTIVAQKMRCSLPALGANAASGRFRIFKEGDIMTDYGPSKMSPEAGANVIKVFRQRGNDIPIDLRHGMLTDKPTLEESEAYGWIPCPNGLQYVKGDGLYAVGVQWDPRVKAGLEAKPPRWKYFSPAYDQDPDTKVILSLDNVALTNLPATHSLNRLAAEKRRTSMDLAKLGMALIAATNGAESGDESCVAIRDALIDALGDQVDAAVEAAQSMMAAPESQELAATTEPNVSADATEPNMAAAATEPEVKAESGDKMECVTAEALLLMARGAESKVVASREQVLAQNAHLIPKDPELHKLLRVVSEKELAKFLAGRKTSTAPTTIRQEGQKRTVIAGKKPEARPSTGDVDPAIKAEIARIAKATPGTDTKKVLAELMRARTE